MSAERTKPEKHLTLAVLISERAYLWACICRSLCTAAHSRLRRSWPLTARLRRANGAPSARHWERVFNPRRHKTLQLSTAAILISVHFALTSGYFFDMRRKSCAAASWDLPVIAAATSTTLICGETVAVFRIWQTLSLPSNAASCLDNEHLALALHCTLLSCVECFTRWAQIQHWWATNPVVQFSCSKFGFLGLHERMRAFSDRTSYEV